MPEGKKPAEDLYSAKTHLHQPVPEVSTVNATALPADAPEGALPSEVRPEIVTWEKLCEAIKASALAPKPSINAICTALNVRSRAKPERLELPILRIEGANVPLWRGVYMPVSFM